MIRLTAISALAFGIGCHGVLAQSAEVPAGQPTVSGTVAAPGSVGTAVPAPEAMPPRTQDDPNRTGSDKINGLEVPQMKDSREGGRE